MWQPSSHSHKRKGVKEVNKEGDGNQRRVTHLAERNITVSRDLASSELTLTGIAFPNHGEEIARKGRFARHKNPVVDVSGGAYLA